jgi:hypothetical protein
MSSGGMGATLLEFEPFRIQDALNPELHEEDKETK